MLKSEFQSLWKDKKLTLSIVVMFIMPVLYAGMLLWAFWDPYGHLENLPVAIVNEDEGAEFEGETLHLGDELINNLLDNGTFHFIEVSSDEANKMLENRDVYIVIDVPKEFSAHATTLLDENPKKLELNYRSDESANFLSSTIGENAVEKIKSEVSKEIATTYADQLFGAISTLSDGFADAADGAVKINDGVVELKDGTVELKDYLYTLASSSVKLNDGTQKLVDGIAKATNGSNDLKAGMQTLNEKAPALSQGAEDVAAGAASLQSGIINYTDSVEKVQLNQQSITNGQASLQQGITDYVNNIGSLQLGSQSVQQGSASIANEVDQLSSQLQSAMGTMTDEQRAAVEQSLAKIKATSTQVASGAQSVSNGANELQQAGNQLVASSEQLTNGQKSLQEGLNSLVANNGSLTTGIQDLTGGAQQLASGVKDYTAGVAQAATGVNTLNNGLVALNSGASELSTGTNKLVSSSNDLAEGADKLADGTTELQDGTSELANSLQDAGEESKLNTSESNSEMVAEPIQLNKEIQGEISNYGSGFAPYFLSLGLFVGALLLTNVYPFVEPAVRPTSIVNWFMSKSAVPVIVGIFQVGIISFVVLKWLGLEVEHVGVFLLITAVTSFCFLAIVQMFTVVAGDVGRFFALIFLILQLASSAGTFPIELVPKTLQTFHTFMPMSYSVEAYRSVITSMNMDIITKDLIILGSVGVVSVAITFAFFALLFKRRYSKPIEKEA